MDLILKCIHNHPQSRAHTSEIVEQLAEMMLKFPASFANRLDILRHINALEVALTEKEKRKDRIIQQMEILVQRQELQAKDKEKATVNDQQCHSIEVQHLQLQLQDINTQNQLIKAETEADITELKSKITTLAKEAESKVSLLLQKVEQFKTQLTREREENRNLATEKDELQSKLYVLEETVSKLETNIIEHENKIQMKETSAKRMVTEIEVKSRALDETNATISAMSKQLTNAREYLTLNKQVSTYKQHNH